MTDLQRLMSQIQDFCDKRDWAQFHGPKDLAIGISTEASELLEIFRFLKPDEEALTVRETRRSEIGEELADILFMLLRFAQVNGFDLEKCFQEKMKVNETKYPVDLARGSNVKYSQRAKTST